MSEQGLVLLVDDEAMVREATAQWLELSGFEVRCFSRAEAALEQIEPFCAGILLTDVRMPGMDGIQLMQEAFRRAPDMPVILLTAHGDVDMATAAMRDGAYDFIEKPYVPDRLVERLRRACEKRRLTLENLRLQQNLATQSGIDARLIGISPAIQRLRREILSLAELETNVIIYGETGTGKELVAQCLHDYGKRSKRPFVPINCGAIPENLIESELFGHEAGAFTHATKRRIGKFEYASGGSLFLDEIESMPLNLQIKLLRALQEHVIERLGANAPISVDLRVIAAAKVDLREDPQFREDLFYRLGVSELHIPPLRERIEDVPWLFVHYLRKGALDNDREPRTLSDHDLDALQSYAWPGNVRELKNIAIRYAIDPRVSLVELLSRQQPLQSRPVAHRQSLPLAVQVAEYEAQLIREALEQHQGNIKSVMDMLDLPRRTLNQKMQRYGLNRSDFTLS
ncbi:two-component system C4-dicarboxylate transport response regulator DctD [Marinobacterium halophilum]|uniref:Two-component system C4-dicarboxylate transport response regulator DctD n=1 Tax=Marinobacterium halophilum TaxID=267374 RepID=A0A2P8EJ82_9GAMM|nr:sigma-54 dependent transcriptional regulator [Marinobacterium halophilum]PSL09512.1 two-component system C4-dicarboxylate transport response regulator DctD [Marinobacterium halophilum]